MSNEELVELIQSGVDVKDNMTLLYTNNIPYIRSVVSKFKFICKVSNPYTQVPVIEIDDLMNEAYFGLHKAAYSYDKSQGVVFITYAAFWIRQAIKRHVDNCGRAVRVPVYLQAIIYKYNQVTAKYLSEQNREPLVNEYAHWLDVDVSKVKEVQAFMCCDRMESLDRNMQGDTDDNLTVSDTIACDADIEGSVVDEMAGKYLESELWDIVDNELEDDTLSELIMLRFVKGASLKIASEELGIRYSKIREMEFKALRRLRNNKRVKALINDFV